MVNEKRVQIGVPENPEEGLPALSLAYMRVQSVDVEEEIDSEIISTFSEAVTVPSSDGGYSIDISALEAQTIEDFITLKKIFKRLKTETGTLAVYEDIKVKGTSFTSEYQFTGVSLKSNKVSYDAEDMTAREVSLNAEAMEETANGETI